MIEYGLRIAEKRPGEIQKRGVRELRKILQESVIVDPPVSSEISATNYTIPESVLPEVREIVGDAFKRQLLEAQGFGPIRRGLRFASILSYGQSQGNPELDNLKFKHDLEFYRALGRLEKEGFIDKDLVQA